jgi:hypothetical protein
MISLLEIEPRANEKLTSKHTRDFIKVAAETQFISYGFKHSVTLVFGPRVSISLSLALEGSSVHSG